MYTNSYILIKSNQIISKPKSKLMTWVQSLSLVPFRTIYFFIFGVFFSPLRILVIVIGLTYILMICLSTCTFPIFITPTFPPSEIIITLSLYSTMSRQYFMLLTSPIGGVNLPSPCIQYLVLVSSPSSPVTRSYGLLLCNMNP